MTTTATKTENAVKEAIGGINFEKLIGRPVQGETGIPESDGVFKLRNLIFDTVIAASKEGRTPLQQIAEVAGVSETDVETFLFNGAVNVLSNPKASTTILVLLGMAIEHNYHTTGGTLG